MPDEFYCLLPLPGLLEPDTHLRLQDKVATPKPRTAGGLTDSKSGAIVPARLGSWAKGVVSLTEPSTTDLGI
jgi:hypothetical protein